MIEILLILGASNLMGQVLGGTSRIGEDALLPDADALGRALPDCQTARLPRRTVSLVALLTSEAAAC